MSEVSKVKQHLKRTMKRPMKPRLDDCPVCGAKDQATDIIAHGPGIGVLGYECGCSVASEEGKLTEYRKYDGTITKKE
jgi:hypothetical protein